MSDSRSQRSALVTYGSETGNAQDVAEELTQTAERLHFLTRVGTLDEFEPVSFFFATGKSSKHISLPDSATDISVYSQPYRITQSSWLPYRQQGRVICLSTLEDCGKVCFEKSCRQIIWSECDSSSLDLVTAHIPSMLLLCSLTLRGLPPHNSVTDYGK